MNGDFFPPALQTQAETSEKCPVSSLNSSFFSPLGISKVTWWVEVLYLCLVFLWSLPVFTSLRRGRAEAESKGGVLGFWSFLNTRFTEQAARCARNGSNDRYSFVFFVVKLHPPISRIRSDPPGFNLQCQRSAVAATQRAPASSSSLSPNSLLNLPLDTLIYLNFA